MNQILTEKNDVLFSCGPVYQRNYSSTSDVVINQGGTDSGKTYAIMQLLITFAIYNKPPSIDPIMTVVGESIPNLKKGAYRHAKSIFGGSPRLYEYVKAWNETDRTITFKSGWVMEFISCQDEQTAKQGKRQYLFVNEANGIPWAIFWQLAKRTRIRTFIDYNPSAPFWAHEKLIGTGKDSNDLSATVDLIISDHRHNPFLSEQDHYKTENIKDPELWSVYARGKTGNLTGLIYPNWRTIPDEDFPKGYTLFAGLDLGYTNDPTALTKIARVGDSVFIHELHYKTGINEESIATLLKSNGFTEANNVWCDHDNDVIANLRRLRIRAIQAIKGPGSISAGITKLKKFDVYYTQSSRNIHEERIRYMWKKELNTGKLMNEPEGGFDHALDSIRMGVYSEFFRRA